VNLGPQPDPPRRGPPRQRPHVIVLGNEKGGSGKSTTAMHVVVALLRAGGTVGTLDLDARQGTLTRYVENRRASAEILPLPLPRHSAVLASRRDSAAEAAAEDRARFAEAMAGFADCDFVVIDTPGSDTGLSRIGHSHADTLVTPLNDSFLDLDLLARLDPEGKQILGPSVYAEAVWEQRKRRALADGGSIEWIVMRNRLSSLDARNKRDIGRLLEELSKRIGFRLAPGFTERVIFRELFPRGLTLLDLDPRRGGPTLNMSHVAARQEVRSLLHAIGLQAPARPAVATAEATGTG
jgi:chromosome partitioning protein